MGRKESIQTKLFSDYFYPFSEFDMDDSTEEDEFYSDYLGNRKAKKCNHSNMKCTTQTNDQWRTPPYWRGNFFCHFVSVTPVVTLLFIHSKKNASENVIC